MPDKTLIIARDTALYMAAAMVVVIGAVGLWAHWLGVVYPLSAMLLPDNALAVLMAGLGLLAVMLRWSLVQRLTGGVLLLHMGYTLLHNLVAGSRLAGSSWVTGDVRMGTLSSTVLILVALCLLLGTSRRYWRWLWAGVGCVVISLGLLSVLRLFLPGGELSWTQPHASSPLLGTTLALLYGGAMLLTVIGGSRPQPRMGNLALAAGLFGVLLSCSAWYTLNWHYQVNKQLQARHVLDNLQFNAEQVMEQQLQLIQRMAERLDAAGPRLDMSMLGRDVQNYLRDSPSLQEIGLQGADEWRWHWARSAEAGRWMQRQLADAEVSEWVSRGHDSPRLFSPDRERREMALITMPVASMGQRLMAGMDLAVLFEHELRVQLANYEVRMLRGDMSILELYSLEHPRLEAAEYPVLARRAIELPGGPNLTLEISPNSAPEMLQTVLIPGSVGMAGLLLSYLMAFSVGLAYQRQQDRRSLWESKQRYRSLFAYNPDAVFSINSQGDFVSANTTCSTITGVSLDALIGAHVSRFVLAEDAERMQAHLDETREGKAQRFEVWVVGRAGDQRLLDLTMLPIRVGDVTQGVYGIAKDVTERHHGETRLRVLNRSVEASVNGVVITDARQDDHPIIYVNEAFQTLTGYTETELLGRNCRILQGERTNPVAVAQLRRRLAEERDCHVMLCNYRKDGSIFWNALYVSPVPDAEGRVTHFVGVLNDATEHKAYEERLAHGATHDALTGLGNRTFLEERLRRDYVAACDTGSVLGVFFVDLDGFKAINDSLSHAFGDKILVEVARRLNDAMRPVDTLVRLGGDEFVILLPGLVHAAQAALAERLLQVLSRPYRIDVHEVYLSASIGIATSDTPIDQPMELIQHADLAMYQAKQQGRNAYQWFSREITTRANERLAMRNELQEAIDGNQLELHYQPLYDRAGNIITVEALLRWKHPTKGYVPPEEFIPLAEETGQIMPISQWVLEQACYDIGTLHVQGFEALKVAVNLSPLQFHRTGFLENLRDTLVKTGFSAERLELELTEGVLLNDAKEAVELLCALRKMHIDISIDDFGTGFSSLSYLKHLPISKVKIDRSFVSEVVQSADDASIVQAIISMAHHLGLAVVAEGIETEAQHRLLNAYGCDVFQGFLLARPMPLAKLEEQLQRDYEIS